MQLPQKPRRKPNFHLEVMDEDILLYDPADTKIMNFNQTATLIWQLCDGERTADEIVELLQAAYPDAAGEIPQDVKNILRQFEKLNCIEPR